MLVVVGYGGEAILAGVTEDTEQPLHLMEIYMAEDPKDSTA